MRVLAYDAERKVYTLPALSGAYACPDSDGYFATGGTGSGGWLIKAYSLEDLDTALAWLLRRDPLHGGLAKHGAQDYIHKPTGLVVRRELEPWPNGKNNTVHWRSTIDGVDVEWHQVRNCRNLLRAIHFYMTD